MNLHLDGRRAAVAAASRGLGLACAEALAADGRPGRDLRARPGHPRGRRRPPAG